MKKYSNSRWRPISRGLMRPKRARTCEIGYTSFGRTGICYGLAGWELNHAPLAVNRLDCFHSGTAFSPCVLDSFDANDARVMTTAIRAITMVQMALISGFTPSRTSE